MEPCVLRHCQGCYQHGLKLNLGMETATFSQHYARVTLVGAILISKEHTSYYARLWPPLI